MTTPNELFGDSGEPNPNELIPAILARLKKPGEIINEDRNRTHDAWDEWCPFPEEAPMVAFAASLLDLVQRQDEELESSRIAMLGDSEARASFVSKQSATWAALEALRAERDALKEELKRSVALGDRIYEDYVLNQGCAGKYFAREKRLREYAVHQNGCRKCVDGCTCGLDALLKEAP